MKIMIQLSMASNKTMARRNGFRSKTAAILNSKRRKGRYQLTTIYKIK